MRSDRLAGIVLIVIGALALFGRSLGAGAREWGAQEILDSREETFEAGSIETLRLDVEAGRLVILGDRSASNVSLRADFLGPKPSTLRQLELTHSRVGKELHVETRTGHSRGLIDLELRIPNGLALRIEDGSGSIELAGVDGSVSIRDGSGSIRAKDLGGALSIQDGSGSITIERVGGAVEIRDGSGSLSLIYAGEDAWIEDSSGSINVQGVAGDVTIRDGSGSITVRDIDGRFHLASDGSGTVSTSGIRGGIHS